LGGLDRTPRNEPTARERQLPGFFSAGTYLLSTVFGFLKSLGTPLKLALVKLDSP
jgi:hypothetical protein